MDSGEKDRQQFRRLSLGDFFLLTLCVAVALAGIAPHMHQLLKSADYQTSFKWFNVTRDLSDFTAIGISFFGLSVLFRERMRGTLKTLSPGHWIFLAITPPYIVYFVGRLIQMTNLIMNSVTVAVIVVSIIVSARALFRLEWQWKICLSSVFGTLLSLAALSIAGIVQSLHWMLPTATAMLLIASATTAQLLTLATMVSAVAIDVWKKNSRDWLHYTAIGPIALAAFSFAFSFGDITWKSWLGLFSYLLA